MSLPSVVVELVRVVVLAPDPLSRAGLTSQLGGTPGLRVLPEQEAARADVVVCVAEAAEAAELVRRVLASGARRAVAVVGDGLDDTALLQLVGAGAAGVLRRGEVTARALCEAVTLAASGDGSLPADLLARLFGQVSRLGAQVLAPRGLSLTGLSTRETRVLALLADGADTGEIARTLSYSERTVKNVVHDLTTRLGVRNRTAAVAYALRAGLIP